MLQLYEEKIKRQNSGKSQLIKYISEIKCGTLLPDGRFAFLLVRETEDLRTFIDYKMMARISPNSGPLPMILAFQIMYRVAKGMDELHDLNIVHRDLKASNVLCAHFNKNSDKEAFAFYVADFECSIGVVGTGFFRAPEILQAIKDKVVSQRQDLFTKASDVYSYGMVCYEILTGKLPFEGHPTSDYDLTICGQQLEVPHYVDEWICSLLRSCWQFDPATRPTFREILKLLESKSKVCEELKKALDERESMPYEKQKSLAPKYEFEF